MGPIGNMMAFTIITLQSEIDSLVILQHSFHFTIQLGEHRSYHDVEAHNFIGSLTLIMFQDLKGFLSLASFPSILSSR